jgi:hypothetical protein
MPNRDSGSFEPLTDFREATAKPFDPGASRRKFLKTLAMAGAGSALRGHGALAQAISPSVLPMRGRIDVHHHLFPPFYIEAMKDQLAASGFTLRQWSPAISLDMMDKHGIATAFVSPVQRLVMDSQSGRDEKGRSLARKSNEYVAQIRFAPSYRIR